MSWREAWSQFEVEILIACSEGSEEAILGDSEYVKLDQCYRNDSY